MLSSRCVALSAVFAYVITFHVLSTSSQMKRGGSFTSDCIQWECGGNWSEFDTYIFKFFFKSVHRTINSNILSITQHGAAEYSNLISGDEFQHHSDSSFSCKAYINTHFEFLIISIVTTCTGTCMAPCCIKPCQLFQKKWSLITVARKSMCIFWNFMVFWINLS